MQTATTGVYVRMIVDMAVEMLNIIAMIITQDMMLCANGGARESPNCKDKYRKCASIPK